MTHPFYLECFAMSTNSHTDRFRWRRQTFAFATICGLALPSAAAAAGAERPVSDSADVVGAVSRFHAALTAGDSTMALALLAPDVTILESGAVETRAEYRASHLKADIDAARAGTTTRTVTRVVVQGDAAWVVSTSSSQREAGGRQISSAGAELMVLRRASSGWQITAIHWSSRRRTP
jgi:ketosteroid isomerase-like protein